MPMISVIVPVFKMEKYIERCVESILSQTYDNFELILVNDGSPDRSGELCDALAKTDIRIRVIHKENGGVSAARNAGLDNANGEYVFFCDADDTLPKETLEKMTCAIHNSKTQLVVGDLTNIHIDELNNKISTTKSNVREYRCVDTCDADALHTLWKTNNMLSSCGKLFLRNIIEKYHLRFCTEMVVMEDYAFVIDYVSYCKSLCMIPDAVYTYFSKAGVSVADKRSRRDFFDDILLASQKLEEFVAKSSPKLAETYQQETIYYTLLVAYKALWTIVPSNNKQRKQKYKRIARAINNERAQRMFLFYKANFSRLEYFFIKRGCIGGILAVHGLRRALKPLL